MIVASDWPVFDVLENQYRLFYRQCESRNRDARHLAKRMMPKQPKRKRRGRPPLPRQLTRSVRVVTFVSEGEKMSLDRLVEDRHTSLSAVCHELIARGLERETSS